MARMSEEYLKTYFQYNLETGYFIWIKLKKFMSKDKLGNKAGWVDAKGYTRIKIGKKHHYAHQLAFLYMTGSYQPDGLIIDHINRNKSDNRWSNLRLVDGSQNCLNRTPENNKSGYRGVFFDKNRTSVNKWRSYIKHEGKNIILGYFLKKEYAAYAFNVAALILRKDFAYDLNTVIIDSSNKSLIHDRVSKLLMKKVFT